MSVLTTARAPVGPPAFDAAVYVAACMDERQGCRSFHCPRVAEVVVKYDWEAPDDPTRDWFWCLGHWPLLRKMFRERGREIVYSPEARALVGADEAQQTAAGWRDAANGANNARTHGLNMARGVVRQARRDASNV